MVFLFGSGAVRDDTNVQNSVCLLPVIVAMAARDDHQKFMAGILGGCLGNVANSS